jgi:hypothetical protein
MSDNAYNTALTLWNFARVIKDQLDEVGRGRAEVIDFTNISVPAGTGYNVCLELAGYGFRLHAVPERYDRTGRISLYVDNALTVRAWDRGGENATAEDPEYTGEDPIVDAAAASQADLLRPEDLTHQSNRTTAGSTPSERIVLRGDRIEGDRTQGDRIERARIKPAPIKARPINPPAMKPDPVESDAIQPDPIKGDPVKPNPIAGGSTRSYSAKRAPIKPDSIKSDGIDSNRRDRIT